MKSDDDSSDPFPSLDGFCCPSVDYKKMIYLMQFLPQLLRVLVLMVATVLLMRCWTCGVVFDVEGVEQKCCQSWDQESFLDSIVLCVSTRFLRENFPG